nr:formate dehydrogenase accessory sulfurtransferase FdhD [Bacillus massiliigorillae]
MNKGCPEEYPISLIVNGYEIAIFQLTKLDLEDWVYGYLYSEGIITHLSDIKSIHVEEEQGIIRVELSTPIQIEAFFQKKKHYTAGCGRGVTFFSMTDVKSFQPIDANVHYQLSYLMQKRVEFSKLTPLYLQTGGMHAACIVERNGQITVREDIGRHNAVDKIIGHCLRNGLNSEELVIMTTGRISYEMLSKVAKFGFPVALSRTAATKQAVQLAKFLQIELIGYVRGKMSIPYTSFGRVTNDVISNKK